MPKTQGPGLRVWASGDRPCSGTCAQTMPESESSSALGRLGRRGLWNERASARNKLLPIEQDLPVWRHCPQSGCASSHLTFLLRHSKLIDQARPGYLAPIAVAGNMAPDGHRGGSGVGLKWERQLTIPCETLRAACCIVTCSWQYCTGRKVEEMDSGEKRNHITSPCGECGECPQRS